MIHYLIFSGLYLAIVLGLCITYYRKKMISLRSLLISMVSWLVMTVLIYFFIYK